MPCRNDMIHTLMLDRIIGHLKIGASGKNGLFGSLQTHCGIVTHLLTRLPPKNE